MISSPATSRSTPTPVVTFDRQAEFERGLEACLSSVNGVLEMTNAAYSENRLGPAFGREVHRELRNNYLWCMIATFKLAPNPSFNEICRKINPEEKIRIPLCKGIEACLQRVDLGNRTLTAIRDFYFAAQAYSEFLERGDLYSAGGALVALHEVADSLLRR